jgi:nicotinate-nucleotide adenylyltransferase
MRVGIFGGTFDPVHIGHLILAEQAREQAELDSVWFVPAPRPPHKEETVLTRFEQRVEMLQLAIAGNPAFQIDELEKERTGPSYTADTLEQLKSRHLGDELVLMVGSDTLVELHNWHNPQRVVELAALAVMARPGHAVASAEKLRQDLKLPADAPLRFLTIETFLFDVSSHDLRRRIAAGRSIRYLVPRAVECYIHEKRLYRPAPSR